MLITTRLSFLQQIQKSAISGYCFYTTGSMDIQKLPSLIKKFEKQYKINQTRQQAYLKRKKGEASAKFFAYADETDLMGQKVFWVLMFTAGTTSAIESEQLNDLRIKKERFEYSDYQLIQKPKRDGKQKFTFSLTVQAFEFYSERIRNTVRSKRIFEIQKLVTHISKMPGFSGIREQRKKLISIYQGELKRAFKADELENGALDLPTISNYYQRQQEVKQVARINLFIKQMLDNARTVKQQLKTYRDNNKKRQKPGKVEPVFAGSDNKEQIHEPAKKKGFLGLFK